MDSSLYHAAAHNACAIIADNRIDGYLSTVREVSLREPSIECRLFIVLYAMKCYTNESKESDSSTTEASANVFYEKEINDE